MSVVMVPREAPGWLMNAMVSAAQAESPNVEGRVGYVQIRAAWDTAIAMLSAAPSEGGDEPVAWRGPGEKPHEYFPDVQAMGDCAICGHTREAHDPSPGPAVDRVAVRERVAQWLHDEVEWPDPYVGHVWPLHDRDDGYRGGGAYVTVQPKDIVERFREIAGRLLSAIKSEPAPSVGEGVRERVVQAALGARSAMNLTTREEHLAFEHGKQKTADAILDALRPDAGGA